MALSLIQNLKSTMRKNIVGTMHYQDLGPGFWGISDARGERYRPITVPKALEKEGLRVELTVQIIQEEASLFMWGTTVKIIDYQVKA